MVEFIKALGPGVAMAVLGSVLTFAATSYWAGRSAKRAEAEKILAAREELLVRINELENRLALVGQTIQPLTMAFQAFLVKQLTHYHTPRTDELLAKLDPFVLTDEEENELFSLMVRRTREHHALISPMERVYARALPLVIAMVRGDQGLQTAVENLTVIAVQTRDESLNNADSVELKMIAVRSTKEDPTPQEIAEKKADES